MRRAPRGRGPSRRTARPRAPRPSTYRTATSSSGSNRTASASYSFPLSVATRIERRIGAGDDVGVGHDVLPGDREPGAARGVAAGGRGDLDDARQGRLGERLSRSGRRGGRPAPPGSARSRRRPPAARWRRARGRARARSPSAAAGPRPARAALVEVCAASVSRGTGPIASSPPTSQMMRSAWADPDEGAGDAVRRTEDARPELGRQPVPERRADRFADDHRDQQRQQDDERPDGADRGSRARR